MSGQINIQDRYTETALDGMLERYFELCEEENNLGPRDKNPKLTKQLDAYEEAIRKEKASQTNKPPCPINEPMCAVFRSRCRISLCTCRRLSIGRLSRRRHSRTSRGPSPATATRWG